MTKDSATKPDDTDSDNREDVQDDAVIGSAFRASLIVAMLAGLPLIGVLVYLNLNKERAEKREVENVTNPTERKVVESEIPQLDLVDVSDACGIKFTHQSGQTGDKLLPETMGSGLAVLDYNNDGHQDIFFVNSKRWDWDTDKTPSSCKLFQGNGKFQFTDVSKEAGLDISLYGMGVAVGDYDNDGDTDLFVSAVGKNRLMQNDGGKFTDVTDQAGVGGSDETWGTSCGFFDYDNDGLLDLFVCNYVTWSKKIDLSQKFTLDGESRAYGPPKAFAGSFSYLYHNDGDGKFSDVSKQAGIQVRNGATDVPLGKAMGLAPVDVNRDGWIDIIVANDTVGNFLFENNKDGTFTEKGNVLGIAYDRDGSARGAMGIDSSYFRANGTLAIGIGNFANEPSALYMASRKRSQFVDGAMATGLGPPTRQGLTFGLFFFDVDLDGRPDVLGANGHLEEEIAKTQRTQKYAQIPQLFWNAGRGSDSSELVEVPEKCTGKSFCTPIVGRGAAYGDFDGDGDQDVAISVSNGSPRIFRNDQATGNHWLRVTLRGESANRDGIGALVTVKTAETTVTKQVMPTCSYLSQAQRDLTFGLGKSDSVESVTVVWPGGQTDTEQVSDVDTAIEISESAKSSE